MSSYCDNEIELLTSYSVYKDFNGTRKQILKTNKCDELKSKLSKTDNVSDFCNKLHRNITEVSINTNASTRNSENCKFLNYWLYYTLFKNDLLDNTNNIAESEFIKNLDELWEEADINKKCDLTKYNMNINYFKYTKELYDYSKNYENLIKSKNEKDADICRKYYCSYIENAKNIYNYLKPECSTQKSNLYCNMFNEITTGKNPNDLYDQFNCSEEYVDESLLNNEKIFELIQESTLNNEGHVNLRLPAPVLLDRDSRGSLPEESADNQQEEPSSNSSVKVGLSTFGMSLVPLFLIYKFTPGGNFLRRIISQKIGTNYNTGEIPSGDWFSISRAHQNDIQTNKEFNVLYQNIEKK
ncbi:VIR protein [Plasmodium vivax]|uniref:VIR protein n=1 Tax=Plasmodium vivax TaxID=5855 RepID=A0A1G4EAB3_PLAVI|nr:VIR protein [Plasmodium vivax]